MNLSFPFQLDGRGRTAAADDDVHVRDLIEQLIFTSPGERVNRPDFGSGLMQMVFAPNSPELAATIQFTLQAALQQWLGNALAVQGVEVTCQDSTLQVTVRYTLRLSQQVQTAQFTRDI